MVNKSRNRFTAAYSIILSVSVLVVGILLTIACLDIYRSGDSPFNREIIAEHLERIFIPIVICILLTLGGAVISLFSDIDDVKIKNIKSLKSVLASLHSNFDISEFDESTVAVIAKESKLRKLLLVSSIIVCAISGIVSAIYVLFFATFTIQNLNTDVIKVVLFILPFVVLAFLCVILISFSIQASIGREIAAIKQAIANLKLHATKHNSETENIIRSKKTLLILRGAVLIIGAVFIIMGIFNGGMNDVLEKAVRICTECIGLG